VLQSNFGCCIGTIQKSATYKICGAAERGSSQAAAPVFDHDLSPRIPWAKLAKRGHAKSKRTDLRIVGLALLVSLGFEGNQNDSVTFSGVLDELVSRYGCSDGKCENVTLVFDKGNNSTENFEELDDSPYHFIGSLVPS